MFFFKLMYNLPSAIRQLPSADAVQPVTMFLFFNVACKVLQVLYCNHQVAGHHIHYLACEM